MQMILHIQIIVQHRLQALSGHILVHGIKASRICYLELLIALVIVFLAGVFAFMVAYTRGNSQYLTKLSFTNIHVVYLVIIYYRAKSRT